MIWVVWVSSWISSRPPPPVLSPLGGGCFCLGTSGWEMIRFQEDERYIFLVPSLNKPSPLLTTAGSMPSILSASPLRLGVGRG